MAGLDAAARGRLDEPVLDGLLLDLLVGEEGELLGGLDVRLALDVALGEDDVDLLERAPRRLRVVQVDEGQEAGVDNGEKEVRAPSDARDHDGRDHDCLRWEMLVIVLGLGGLKELEARVVEHTDNKVEQPVGAGRHGIGLASDLDRVDLGRVQPWQGQPGRAERGNVREETHSRALCDLGVAGDQACESDDHGQALAYCAPEEKLPSASALDDEP